LTKHPNELQAATRQLLDAGLLHVNCTCRFAACDAWRKST